MNQETFAEWLRTYANIKPYSIGRYSKAIGTISSELEDYGLQSINLFNLTDAAFIDEILSNSELQAELFKEEQQFEKYLIGNPADVSTAYIGDKPNDKPKHSLVKNIKV